LSLLLIFNLFQKWLAFSHNKTRKRLFLLLNLLIYFAIVFLPLALDPLVLHFKVIYQQLVHIDKQPWLKSPYVQVVLHLQQRFAD